MSAKKNGIFGEPKRKLTLEDDEVWSDEESDYLVHLPPSEAKNKRIEEMASKGDKSLPKVFSGSAKIIYNADNYDNPEKNIPKEFLCDVPLPYVAPHIKEILGEETVHFMWEEFVRHGSDETELLLTESIHEVADAVNKFLGYELPFNKLKFTMGEGEYTDFKYVTQTLAKLRNDAGVVMPQLQRVALLPKCCANKYCERHRNMDQRVLDGYETRPDFRLDVVYRRWVLRQGVVRVNHIPQILDECEIQYDLSMAPEGFWDIEGDRILYTYDDLEAAGDIIRLDTHERRAQVDIYKLPRWLMNEFTPSEVSMFKHHFMMIDIDCGGTIDAEELQLLGDSLGNKISPEEAQHLIDSHDDDGSGTIDFEEFMTLMFKLMRGTIDVQNDALAQAMMESKNQIKIFEEIEDIKHNPPDLVSVHSYGGNPVECLYLLEGPPDSLYAGGRFLLKVVYVNGYPFSCPETCILTRMVHINLVVQMNGSVSLPHLKNLWESSWSSRDIIQHVLDLMVEPNPSLLPVLMIDVFNAFMLENFELEDDSILIRSAFAEQLEMDLMVSDPKKGLEYKMDKLPRLDQMHMNIVAKYFTDNEAYQSIVRQFVDKFAINNIVDNMEDQEKDQGESQEEQNIDVGEH